MIIIYIFIWMIIGLIVNILINARLPYSGMNKKEIKELNYDILLGPIGFIMFIIINLILEEDDKDD